ncbi:metal ABC transporter ATP-binding protein [Phocicoccus pinnipedialis]|uniref:Putative ABC transporter ATP-binding protein n=1 Tax=Phocicoccus pinnipedialis TaxID=110845 RepID=A0A6V7R4I4_9BACL|nr:metal ABC transporter ATP-binding protein [Jeotgalicoccus pinnipedialis]MBP1940108.1 iron/zinc/copper transport system ATP-binding protein [Jeotgalicoccus pinnipedialis]CAD2071944.1 putative ABC transporter ATP-binding protein [Jeotgalicoccus pinnipedialis]
MFKVNNLGVTYNNKVRALENANVELPLGKIYGIIGPNGAGKSSFIKGVLNLVKHTGEVTVDGTLIKKKQRDISYVAQRSDLDMTFPISVLQCVVLGTIPGLGLFKRPGKKEFEIAKEALEKVGMLDYKDNQIGELSGGQFQRVLIARALAQKSKLVFLDEPFVGIDVHSEEIIIKVIRDLRKEGVTIFIIHHDLSKARDYFDGLILINKTILAYGNVDDVFTEENLKLAYGSNIFVKVGENS